MRSLFPFIRPIYGFISKSIFASIGENHGLYMPVNSGEAHIIQRLTLAAERSYSGTERVI